MEKIMTFIVATNVVASRPPEPHHIQRHAAPPRNSKMAAIGPHKGLRGSGKGSVTSNCNADGLDQKLLKFDLSKWNLISKKFSNNI